MTTYAYSSIAPKTPTCVLRTDLERCHRDYKPCHNEILIVQLDDPSQRITPITGTLHGIFVNVRTNQELYRYTKELHDTELFAVASTKFPGFHYVVGYSGEIGAFACSCLEARRLGFCCHDQEVQEYVNEEAMRRG